MNCRICKTRMKMGIWFMAFVCGILYVRAVSGDFLYTPTDIGVDLLVYGKAKIAEIDEDFVCATLDWWPPQKCNYGVCPWGNASILNLDLDNPILKKAVQVFSPLKIRIGGTLQDKLRYGVGSESENCYEFSNDSSQLFGFTDGCLSMERWDAINSFMRETQAAVVFGLNALTGRHPARRGNSWEGAWNSTNARSFIQYTVDHDYNIQAWEFGNELSGSGVGASVTAHQYAADLITLHEVLDDIYSNSQQKKPSLIAPGGFFDWSWFEALLQETKPKVLNAITHHIYNLGAASDPHLINKILDPTYLDKVSGTFQDVASLLQHYGSGAAAWVGEAGGAYNSGRHMVSDAFVNSFWYLDQLGMASKFGTTVYCRQSLTGGNYGLLDKDTFVPNPDYYSALLWHRLMGRAVLSLKFTGTAYLRAYAHCTKNDTGVTLLLINLSNSTGITLHVSAHPNITNTNELNFENSLAYELKKILVWTGNKISDIQNYRMEYHLTPKDGNLQSRQVLLNDALLELTEAGDIPKLDPLMVDSKTPITLAPLSIAFVSVPGLVIAACLSSQYK